MLEAGLRGVAAASALVLGALVGLADTMIPEAFAGGGDLAWLATVFGFATAFLLSTVS